MAYDQQSFATPAFLCPTAPPIESPQSPLLLWERIPRKIKGFSALISDSRAKEIVDEVDHESWKDEEEPSDLEDARRQFDVHVAQTGKKRCENKVTTRKAKGGYKIGKQVSDNFVSYKIRSKGRGRGRLRGGRFQR